MCRKNERWIKDTAWVIYFNRCYCNLRFGAHGFRICRSEGVKAKEGRSLVIVRTSKDGTYQQDNGSWGNPEVTLVLILLCLSHFYFLESAFDARQTAHRRKCRGSGGSMWMIMIDNLKIAGKVITITYFIWLIYWIMLTHFYNIICDMI